MKKIIRGWLEKIMLKDKDFIPIYSGNELISFEYRKVME